MDNVNKIISFILGLIVVIVFIAIVTGKFNLGKSIKSLSSAKVTPTVTPAFIHPSTEATNSYVVTPAVTKPLTTYPTGSKISQYNSNGSGTQVGGRNLSAIPNTGAPTFLIPLVLSMLAGGTFLRKSARG